MVRSKARLKLKSELDDKWGDRSRWVVQEDLRQTGVVKWGNSCTKRTGQGMAFLRMSVEKEGK